MEEKFEKKEKNEIKNSAAAEPGAAYLTLSDRFICAGRDELWEEWLGGGGGVTFFFSAEEASNGRMLGPY